MATLEPAFQIDENTIFLGLHHSALSKAKTKVKDAKEIVNTAITDNKFGGSKDNVYELAVIYEQKNYEDPTEGGIAGDEANQRKEHNQADRDRLREDALNGIVEYFAWFSGRENANHLKKTNLKMILPDQDHDARVVDYKISTISDEDYKDWTETKHKKPRIGFKVVYKIDSAGEEGGEK